MSQGIAECDITRENDLGQQVVVVPAGQPIPEGFDSASTGLRQTEAATSGVADGTTPVDYSVLDVPALEQKVAERELEVTGTGKDGNVLKADLIAALEADDKKKSE